MNEDRDRKETTESEAVEEQTEYKKPKLTEQGDLKEITALSLDPPGS